METRYAGARRGTHAYVPDYALVLGNPGRIVRPCGEKERAMIEHGWREYVERGREYRARDHR